MHEVELSRQLSRTPIGSVEYYFPYEKMSNLLRNGYGFKGKIVRGEQIRLSENTVPVCDALPDGVSNIRAERLWPRIPRGYGDA